MDKYFIKTDDIMYLTYSIGENHIITCEEIEWCGRDAECGECIFDNEREDFEPRTLKEFKHIKIDDVVF